MVKTDYRLTHVLCVFVTEDWGSTVTVLAQYWDSTGTVLAQYWLSTGPILAQSWPSTGTILAQCWHSTCTVLTQYWHSTGTVLPEYSQSTHTVLNSVLPEYMHSQPSQPLDTNMPPQTKQKPQELRKVTQHTTKHRAQNTYTAPQKGLKN